MMIPADSSNADSRRGIALYGIAILACIAAGVLQYFLQDSLGGRYPFAAFPLAIVLSAWLGGVGPAVLATLGSAVIAGVFFLPPLNSLRVDDAGDAIGLSLFLLVGLLACALMRVVERSRLQERHARLSTERTFRRTRQLHDLATALSTTQTPSEVMQASLRELLHAFEGAAGAFVTVTNDGHDVEVSNTMGYENGAVGRHAVVPLTSKTLLTEAIRRRVPIGFASREDLGKQFPDVHVDAPLAHCESAIVVPLIVSGRALGAVALAFARSHTPASDEQEFLDSASTRIALGFDRAQRYALAERARVDAEAYRLRADSELRERQKAEEALRESEARYRALAARTDRLYTLSARLSQAITLEAVAVAIVRHGKIVAGASAGSVALLVEGPQFEPLYAEDYPRQIVEAWQRYPAETGLCSTAAVETRLPVFVGSFAEWQQQYSHSASMAADGGYASAAVLPLLVESLPIGVLSFHFTVPVNFDDEYRALLTSVAQHAAQALDRARLYESSQRARTEAEAANRSKDDFLSIVSHELRTPLSAVLGWASMLRNQMLDANRSRRAIESIYTNATRQAHLIDELLDVSRIAAGRASLDLQQIDLGENVGGAVEAIMPLAESKGLEVRVDPLPADVHVVADPRRLEQVFLNLLGNAVKFTPAGGRITVGATAAEGSVEVRVVDTGRGIAPEFLPQVFERFRQADSGAARSTGGLGLGLFIARRLVEAQGGTIDADSEGEGRGSTFSVTLPAVSSAAVGTRPGSIANPVLRDPEELLPSLLGVQVLIVDDEVEVREMMATVLETCGATVLSASSAENALEVVGQRRIDVLLSDIAMPGTDGYQLIREIRSKPDAWLSAVPAAAVTASAGLRDRQRALSAGFQMHLAKPLRPEALARAVASLAGLEEGAGS
jgi:K+-sensing histidine kinase KdpD/ActR/RegA family two-component response regulator